jgi:flagellar M-ring protein FliF
VLVDGITSTGPDGQTVWAPRPDDELSALRELVIAAIGFDEARGDIVTVESMAFQPDAAEGALVETSGFVRALERNAMTLIQIAALTLVALVLALTVVRPILTRPLPAAPAPGHLAAARLAGAPGPGGQIPLADAGAQPGLPAPEGGETAALPASESLRLAVAERPDQTVSMLRDWLAPGDLATGPEEAA